MLKLLTVIASKTPENVHPYTPNDHVIALQLTFKKNIVVDLALNKENDSFQVKVLEMIPEAKATKLRAEKTFSVAGDTEHTLCREIFDEHFSEEQQEQICDHFALLLNGKNVKLEAASNNS